MKIAVLGWGSLIWQPKQLNITGEKWYQDGPLLPLEFKRVSLDGRLTLVICPGYPEVISLYAISSFDNLNQAIDNLRLREGTVTQHIGFYNFQSDNKQVKKANESIFSNLFLWQRLTDIDAVIRTDLSPNFRERTQLEFTIDNVHTHLKQLSAEAFQSAKQYVENVPAQINTKYRQEIQSIFDQLSHKSAEA
ncbi:hypothetical protein [Mucilaginibacter sp. OK283]|jgi:hypothetical protein|uniref:hypothetical protein n=1 Tax=Mucilaginibacter sp. OK283 TaxID=1881049 RepID=UPI0008C944F1|nr:hypothetical protein [Mucilaginibacter sp. OK283]SEO59270.1 hypothetical protein SAMN05428947_10355 [Mucilaginibacter sp. OK283]